MSVALLTGAVLAVVTALAGRARTRARERAAAELIARCGHELRGALSAIGLGLELAGRTGAVSPARVRAMSLELRRARAALADLAGGRGDEPAAARVGVGELLADSVEAWRPAAAPRELRLNLSRLDAADVIGSEPRLAQATGNLIANAIEHGAGTITVSAWSDLVRVRIEVCDDGPGLPVPLSQLVRGPSRRARGHGLRIVDEVVRSHGGRLESGPSGSGARVALELPRAELPLVRVGLDAAAHP